MNPINRLQIRSVEALRTVARAATISAIEQYRLAQAANASVSGIQVRSKDRRLVLWCDLAAEAEQEAEDRLKLALLAWSPSAFYRENALLRRHPDFGAVYQGKAYLVLFRPSEDDLNYAFGEYDPERQTRVMCLEVISADEVSALGRDDLRIVDLEQGSN